MASNLGKRKEREGDSVVDAAHSATLFISNLPYTATSVDLQTLFSDIAPVRTAFVVTEPGSGVSKGVGYVAFALKEDAESCFNKISEEGITLAGRDIRATWADKKVRLTGEALEEKNKKRAANAAKPRPAHQSQSYTKVAHDPLAIRSIIISGLPSGIDSQVLWKKIRKSVGAEKLIWPVKKDNEEEDPSTAHVVFGSPRNAEIAVTKLHAHVYKGSLLSVTLKKRLQNLAKPKKSIAATTDATSSTPTTSTATSAAPSRASRLIVRNLPFNATDQDLRALFLPYGPVHTVDIPKAEGKEGEAPRNKGFAFVWMLSKKDAERALKECNGKTVRAGMAHELVSDKQKKKKQIRLEKRAAAKSGVEAQGSGEVGEDGQEKEKGSGDEDDEEKPKEKEEVKAAASERVIAVDWALSKEKWKEEIAKAEEKEGGDSDVEMGSADNGGSGSESESEEDHDALGVHGEGSDSDSDCESWASDEEGSRDDDDDVPIKPQLPPPESGTTLFIRNVSYDATEEDLRTLFRAFGPLRYARITVDPETGRSRGTGFACFWNKEDADKVIEQSEILRFEMTGFSSAPKKNPFSLPSILTPDPSSSLARTLVLHGRTLDVVRAVTRDVATKLREEGEKLREKQDKRNTYLLREGVIFPNSPLASTIPPAELERRNASYGSRKALLKSNPSLFVSRTRLSVRQLPLFATERMVKRLGVYAVREFDREVKAGKREGLTQDELVARSEETLEKIRRDGVEEQLGLGGSGNKADGKVDAKSKKPYKFSKGKGRDTGVKQSKVVRQAERVDPVTGKGRSKGYGFLEMHQHADALRVLRWSNNNADVARLFEEWWTDELKDAMKKEKGQEKPDEERVKRIQEEIEAREKGKPRKEGGERLIVEFSIENVEVVQRRDRAREAGLAGKKEAKDGKERLTSSPTKISWEAPEKHDKKSERERKSKDVKEKGSQDASSQPPPKKKAKTDKASKGASKAEPAKNFNSIGSVIGRKRKERKAGKRS